MDGIQFVTTYTNSSTKETGITYITYNDFNSAVQSNILSTNRNTVISHYPNLMSKNIHGIVGVTSDVQSTIFYNNTYYNLSGENYITYIGIDSKTAPNLSSKNPFYIKCTRKIQSSGTNMLNPYLNLYRDNCVFSLHSGQIKVIDYSDAMFINYLDLNGNTICPFTSLWPKYVAANIGVYENRLNMSYYVYGQLTYLSVPKFVQLTDFDSSEYTYLGSLYTNFVSSNYENYIIDLSYFDSCIDTIDLSNWDAYIYNPNCIKYLIGSTKSDHTLIPINHFKLPTNFFRYPTMATTITPLPIVDISVLQITDMDSLMNIINEILITGAQGTKVKLQVHPYTNYLLEQFSYYMHIDISSFITK